MAALAKNLSALAAKETVKLRAQIDALPRASVVILEAQAALNNLADENFWTTLSPARLAPKFATQKDSLVELIGELPLSVNIVKREEDLIRQAQGEAYGATITDAALDTLIEKLSPLMKFRLTDENPILQKIKQGQPVSAEEAESLARPKIQSGIVRELLQLREMLG